MKLVEAVVETLPKVDPRCSHIIELHDDAHLVMKIWKRGVWQKDVALRAIGLPVGSYHVVGKAVVHRYSPDQVIAELAAHQRLVRLRSPGFAKVAQDIAKRLGGKLEKWEIDEGGWVAYRVNEPKRAKDLARICKEVASQSIVLFRAGSSDTSPIGMGVAENDLDLCSLLCDRCDDHVAKLMRRIDTECGATLVALDRDLIVLALARSPKQSRPLVRSSGWPRRPSSSGRAIPTSFEALSMRVRCFCGGTDGFNKRRD